MLRRDKKLSAERNTHLCKRNSKQHDISSSSRVREMVNVLRAHDVKRGMTPEKLRLILEDLGPTFIKLGQIVSMRHDVLPASYCDELVRLRADVRPMPFADLLAIIQQEYNTQIQEIFAHIEPKPLGSASIAQVHAATLKDGRYVVLKVQRPHIYETMAKDIALMKRTTKLLKLFSGSGEAIDFNIVIEEMWVVAQQEMNFLLEASHNKQFSALHADVQYVTCPKIIDAYTTSRILMMEYIDGVQIDQIEELETLGYDLNEIGLKLADHYVKQIIDDAFFHADPHPGNIRVRDGKIVWLDLGMMGKLSQRDQLLLRSAVVAIVEHDIDELKHVVLTLGVVRGRINHSRLYMDLDAGLSKYGNIGLNDMNLGELIQDMLKLANQHGISLPQGITLLGRGVMTIEGVLSVCCPNINFVQIMASHISGDMFQQFDFKKEFQLGGRAIYNMTKKSVELPTQLSEFMKQVSKGQAKLNIEIIGSEEPLKRVEKMIDKLVLCVITAALLVGSSLLCMTEMDPKVLGIPLFGLVGFVNAWFWGGWLLYDIFIKGKRSK